MERKEKQIYVNCFFYGFHITHSFLQLYKDDIRKRISLKSPEDHQFILYDTKKRLQSFKSLSSHLNDLNHTSSYDDRKKK